MSYHTSPSPRHTGVVPGVMVHEKHKLCFHVASSSFVVVSRLLGEEFLSNWLFVALRPPPSAGVDVDSSFT